jgi:acyl-CoA thioesterase
MQSRLQRDSGVEPLGDGSYGVLIDRGWWIHRGPNGGYVAAFLVRALEAEVGDQERMVRSTTIHYLRPPEAGPAQVDVVVQRAGRTLSTVTAELHQHGRLLALATAALATERDGTLDFDELPAPEAPDPESISPRDRAAPGAPPQIPMSARYDQRHFIGTPPFVAGPEALTGGWLRQADQGEVDVAALVAYTDAWSPAIFSLGAFVPVPTIDLTVHVRRDPAEFDTSWCLVRFRTNVAAGGFIEEDGEIWSRDGVLLAQSRQLALMMPLPPMQA